MEVAVKWVNGVTEKFEVKEYTLRQDMLLLALEEKEEEKEEEGVLLNIPLYQVMWYKKVKR